MELTMRRSSTLTLVAPMLAVLVGATFAHAYLLSPAQQVDGIASRTSPMVTIVAAGAGEVSDPPIEVASRITGPVTVALSGPGGDGTVHMFGPRSLPSRLHRMLWRDASIYIRQTGDVRQNGDVGLNGDVRQIGGADHFITVAADPAGIACEQVWARPTAGAGTTGAAYFTLTNNGPADQLIGASTPIAASAGVHETIDDNGVMKMRPVASIALAPDRPVTFRPGGYHVMLIGLKAPLKVGDSFPLTLSFAHAQPLTVTVKVQAGAAGMGSASMPGMH
jgi:periplasmic copper chaperone A